MTGGWVRMETVIQVSELTKTYKDVVAVDHLTFCVGESEIFGLLGVNGAGKTTTRKRLCGLSKPTSGDIRILGHSVTEERDKIKPLINISTQETSVAKNLTVKENLDFYASLYELSKREKEEKVNKLLTQFGLDQFKDKRAGKLSGGWQRKLSIALSLVNDPKILFLDEPTLGLDVISRHELWKRIKEISKETTIILTSHYLEEVQGLANRIAVMANGKLKFIGTLNEILESTSMDNLEDAFIGIVGNDHE